MADLKRAKNQNESRVLRAANNSNNLILGIMVASFLGAAGWLIAPQSLKDKISSVIVPAGLFSLGAVQFVLRNFNTSIKEGRLDLGDLESAVTGMALLKPVEVERFKQVQQFVEGTAQIHELPIAKAGLDPVGLQNKINVKTFKPTPVSWPQGQEKTRVIDPNYEAPV